MGNNNNAKRQSVSSVQVQEEQSRKDSESSNKPEFRTYGQRWAILGSLSVLIFSNSMSRLSFGPVAYTSAAFYETTVNTINWFAIVYMVVGIPAGVAVTWFIDKIGVRWSLLVAAWLNCSGAILKVTSALHGVEHTWRLVMVFAGHVLSAIAQPVFMFTPTKVAAAWFPDNQRAIANTLSTMCNPLGILAANLFSPMLVKTPKDILIMTIVFFTPAGLGALLTSIFVRSEEPKMPPSASARHKSEPFWVGIKSLFRNRHYWILFFSVGGGVGVYTAITVFLEQILCPWGYSDFYAGVVGGSCLVFGGVVGAVIAGLAADRTKHFSTIAKISYFFCALSVLFFMLMQNQRGQPVLVALSLGLVGFFGMPLLPLGNELVVETTYPVESATSTGVVFMSGQLQGMLLILILQELAYPLADHLVPDSTCLSDPSKNSKSIRNMTTSCYVLFGYTCLLCFCFVAFFRNTSRRIRLEREQKQDCACPQHTPDRGSGDVESNPRSSSPSDNDSTTSSQLQIMPVEQIESKFG